MDVTDVPTLLVLCLTRTTADQFSFNQHEFLKGGSQKETEDLMLATLKESISLPGRMICLLHPWQDPIPFRRVWW